MTEIPTPRTAGEPQWNFCPVCGVHLEDCDEQSHRQPSHLPAEPPHGEAADVAWNIAAPESWQAQIDAVRATVQELLRERDTFYMDYRVKCDEQAKRLEVEKQELLTALKALLALVQDFGVQDADDVWYEAVAKADAAIAHAEGRT